MKRLISIIALAAVAASVMLLAGLSIAGCNQNSARQTPAPVETPLAEPTEEPNPIQAVRPTFNNGADLGIAAEFPTFAPLGKLTDGPIVPEGAKYFVLYGESNLRYVFDANGELALIYPGLAVEDYWLCCTYCDENTYLDGFSFSRMELVLDHKRIGNIWIEIKDERVIEICDAHFEVIFPIDEEGIKVGSYGGILHLGDEFLVIDRDAILDDENEIVDFIYNRPLILLDKNGEQICEIDPEIFGTINGVFADKYIMGTRKTEPTEDNPLGVIHSFFTPEGKIAKDVVYWYFEPFFDQPTIAGLTASYYFEDSEEVDYNYEFEKLQSPFWRQEPLYELYHFSGYIDGHEHVLHGAYVGIKDADGNWLFKIYNPRLAHDGM